MTTQHRDLSLDSIRSLSMIGIIIAHYYRNPGQSALHIIWSIGNGIAPMWFALLVGISVSLSTRNSPTHMLTRGTILLTYAILLATISPLVIIVLASLALGIILLSAMKTHIPPLYIGITGTAMLLTSPFITTYSIEKFGKPDVYTIDIPSLLTTDGWLSVLATGTYPAIEWSAMILIGYCIGAYRKHITANISIYTSTALITATLTISYLISSTTYNKEHSHNLIPMETPESWIQRLAIVYGHTGSWTSFILGIASFFLLYGILKKVENNLLLTQPLSAIGMYSLFTYTWTSLIIVYTRTSEYIFLSIFIIFLALVISCIMMVKDHPDPISRALKFTEDAVMNISPKRTGNKTEPEKVQD